jgi:hypothetical protein
MSDATKLKNLINKTKPSIQFEVRKKKPKTTTEFLEYAREADELFQLSNINTNNYEINHYLIPNEPRASSFNTIPSSNIKFSHNPSSTKFAPGYSGKFNNNSYSSFSNRNNNIKSKPTTSTSSSFRSPQYFQNQSRDTTRQVQSSRITSSFNNSNSGRNRSQPHQVNSFINNQSPQAIDNINFPIESLMDKDLTQESFPPIICALCNQFGHEEGSCQNFE